MTRWVISVAALLLKEFHDHRGRFRGNLMPAGVNVSHDRGADLEG